MATRIRSMICGSALTLFACTGTTLAEAADEITSLPQWVQRAQQRLALLPAQQRELHVLINDNSEKLEALQERAAKLRRQELESLQREFRHELARILSDAQLAQWDALLEELLGEVHLRNLPLLAENPPLQ
jgi:hypothetical protein